MPILRNRRKATDPRPEPSTKGKKKGVDFVDTAFTLDEAVSFLRQLTLEEFPPEMYPTAVHQQGNVFINAAHQIKDRPGRKYTPSLQVVCSTPNPGYETGICRLHYYGAGGWDGTGGQKDSILLSQYLKLLGPEYPAGSGKLAGESFFYGGGGSRLRSVIKSVKSGRAFQIGFLKWKQERGLIPKEVNINVGESTVVAGGGSSMKGYGLNYKLAERYKIGNYSPEALDILCQARGWDVGVTRRVVEDWLLGVEFKRGEWHKTPDGRSIPEVMLYTPIVGLVDPVDPEVRSRAINVRTLFSKEMYSLTGLPTARIGHFPPFDAVFSNQLSNRVIVTEGEMDAISLRHIYPNDMVYVVFGLKNLSGDPVRELVPSMGLEGKDVVICVDRDTQTNEQGKTVWKMNRYEERNGKTSVVSRYDGFIDSVLSARPKSITLWMHPDGGKDVNDWLQHGCRKLGLPSAEFRREDCVSCYFSAKHGWEDSPDFRSKFCNAGVLMESFLPTDQRWRDLTSLQTGYVPPPKTTEKKSK